MMLHRHFENERNENITRLKDVTPGGRNDEFVSEVFPPDEVAEEPKKRGRPKKSDTE